jgi:hypothetical protein
MAVERATDPSLRSYSPTSSIRAPSEADYDVSIAESITLEPHTDHNRHDAESSTPMSESVATLIPVVSPGETLIATPRKTDEREEVDNAPPSPKPAALTVTEPVKTHVPSLSISKTATASSAEEIVSRGRAIVSEAFSSRSSSASAATTSGLGKSLLGKGKIDAKAQDDFIALMLGKKK